MTCAEQLFVAEDRQTLQDRLAAFLNDRYPGPGKTERLARDINVDPRSARNYMLGYWPGARQWRSMVRTFGREILSAVFDPEIDETHARLSAEVRELEAQLEARKARLRAMASPEKGVAQVEAAE